MAAVVYRAGAEPAATMPWAWVLGAAPVAVLVAGLVAHVPAGRAARMRVVPVLRENAGG